MLKDVLIGLYSCLSSLTLCCVPFFSGICVERVLLLSHLGRPLSPPHSQSMDVGAGQESSRDGTPTSHKPLSSTCQAHRNDACEHESIPSLQHSQDCCLPPFPRKQIANPCNHRDQQSVEGSGTSPHLPVAPGKLLLMRQEMLSLGKNKLPAGYVALLSS